MLFLLPLTKGAGGANVAFKKEIDITHLGFLSRLLGFNITTELFQK
jgi:hypothetical protein